MSIRWVLVVRGPALEKEHLLYDDERMALCGRDRTDWSEIARHLAAEFDPVRHNHSLCVMCLEAFGHDRQFGLHK